MRVNDKENYNLIKDSISMNNLKKIINEKGFIITKVAVNSKVSDTTIKSYMNGSKIPSLPTLVSMANFLNCNLDYLIDRTDNPMRYEEMESISNNKDLAILIQTINNLPNDKLELVKAYIQGIENK